MDQNVIVAIVVVILIAIGYYYYQYTTTCPLVGGTPVPGTKFCGKSHTVASGVGIGGLGNATTAAACANLCNANPACNAYHLNTENNACWGYAYPSVAAMNSNMAANSGFTSGAKLVSRAHPWGG